MENARICVLAFMVLVVPPLSGKDAAEPDSHNSNATVSQNSPQSAPLTDRENSKPPDNEPRHTYADAMQGEHDLAIWGLVINLVLTLATLGIAIFSVIQANAAKIAAKTSQRQTDIIIAKERASLEIDPWGWKISQSSDPLPYSSVTYAVRCHGTTRAEIVEAVVRAKVTDSRESPSDKSYLPMFLAPVLVPGSTTEKEAFFDSVPEIEREISSATFGDPNAIIHFWGYVRYADIFGGRWKRAFRYVWAPPNPYGGGQWQGENAEERDNGDDVMDEPEWYQRVLAWMKKAAASPN